MLFAFICTDKANSLEVRMKLRPDHLAYLNGLKDKLKAAGPFLDDASQPAGSLVIVEADDKDAAAKIARNDPYAIGGLFSSVEIKAWRWAVKNPEAA
jgi:uncharacterized protein